VKLKSQVLISQEQIALRLKQLAHQINLDYQGQTLTVVCVLKGAAIFAADLIRHLSMPVKLEFIGIASYEGTQSTGHVRITHDLSAEIVGANVLLVEDIIDTGKTIDYLLDLFSVRSPASLKICTLLSKPSVHRMRHDVNYVGFEIGDEFVVGYGLDYDGSFRNLPYIAELEP
jgi:hypoxanthine phosphoribosyltransferase